MRLRQSAHSWGKYWNIGLLSLKEQLYYPKKLQFNMLIGFLRVVMMLIVYNYAFHYIGRDINGIDARTAVWSIAIYFLLLNSQFRGLFKTVNDEIRHGKLEVQLNKPYSYLAYKFWEHLGKGMLNFLVSFAFAVPVLWVLTGGFPLALSVERLGYGLVLALAGSLVSASIYTLIVLPALWIDDATPFFWIVDKLILILGGAYIPLALLPAAFQAAANLSPFGAPMFATQMFNPGFPSHFPQFLLMQALWIIVLGSLTLFLFARARKKLSINGG